MENVSVFIPGIPVAQQRLRFSIRGWGKRKRITPHWPAVTKQAMVSLRETIRKYMEENDISEFPVDTALFAEFVFILPRPKSVPESARPWPTKRPDLTNFLKLVEDGLGRDARGDKDPALYYDDAAICAIYTEKRYTSEENPLPGTWITVGIWDGESGGWYE